MHFRPSSLLPLSLLLAACGGAGEPSSTGSTGSTGSTESTESTAAPLSDTKTTYTCGTPIGNINATAEISGNSPKSAAVDAKVALKDFQWTVELPASLVNEAISFGATSASGEATTLDVKATDSTKASVNAAKKGFSFGPITLVHNQALSIPFPTDPETLHGFKAEAAGTMTFTPGNMDFTVTLGSLGTNSVSCTTSSPTTISTTTVK